MNPFDVKTTPIIPAGQTLRPLRDQLLVEPLDWQPSTLIEVVRLGRPVRGVVKAAGPGAYQRKRWTDTQGRKWVKDTDRFIPTQVKPGDVIELGGLNAFDGEGYRFEDDVIFEGKWHFWCTEKDVAMVHDA